MPLQTHSYFTLPWLAMTPLARWHFWSSDHNVMVAGPKGKILTKGFLSPFIYNSQCQSMAYIIYSSMESVLGSRGCPVWKLSGCSSGEGGEFSFITFPAAKIVALWWYPIINFFPFTWVTKGEVSSQFIYKGNISEDQSNKASKQRSFRQGIC